MHRNVQSCKRTCIEVLCKFDISCAEQLPSFHCCQLFSQSVAGWGHFPRSLGYFCNKFIPSQWKELMNVFKLLTVCLIVQRWLFISSWGTPSHSALHESMSKLLTGAVHALKRFMLRLKQNKSLYKKFATACFTFVRLPLKWLVKTQHLLTFMR